MKDVGAHQLQNLICQVFPPLRSRETELKNGDRYSTLSSFGQVTPIAHDNNRVLHSPQWIIKSLKGSLRRARTQKH